MAKAPRRIYPPPPPPPRTVRIFARVRAFDVACPACGLVSAITIAKPKGYDTTTGVWTCRGDSCRKRYVVGLLLWNRTTGRGARPEDQVPTLIEGLALRDALGQGYAGGRIVGGRAARANRVCTCEGGCPMHTPGEGPETAEE